MATDFLSRLFKLLDGDLGGATVGVDDVQAGGQGGSGAEPSQPEYNIHAFSWGYGAYVSAFSSIVLHTENKEFRTRHEAEIKATLQRYYNTGKQFQVLSDGSRWFNAVMVRGFTELNTVEPNNLYTQAIYQTMEHAWLYTRDEATGLFMTNYTGTPITDNPKVAMPAGRWTTFSLVDGDDTDQYQAKLKLRQGSIIPVGRVIQNTNENCFEPLKLIVNLDDQGQATGRLYWDAGDGWEFRCCDYSLLTFKAQRQGNKVKVTVADRQGDRKIEKEIKNVKVELLLDGKVYTATGKLNSGVTVKL